ncbi:MAG: universal stress protein [Bauldia sp.]|nr:universal stress protein [Bauldia sp.]
MKFGDILVCIDASPTGRKRRDLAFALAGRSGARVIGYYVPHEGIPPNDPRKSRQGEEADAAALDFDRCAQSNSLEGQWILGGKSRGVADIVDYSRCADLVVVGLGPPDDPDSDPQGLDVEELVVECGRPVLGIPIVESSDTIGQRVLVAWDGSRACTRALHDAVPFLREAAAVKVVSIDSDSFTAVSATSVVAHLRRLGITAEVDKSLDLRLPIGEEILSRIEREEMDLLVAGAFGRSRIWEHLFGGTSRLLLHQMMIPVLVSH